MREFAKRKVDELGRIVLPLELRNEAGIKPGEELDVGINDSGEVVLIRSQNRCMICNSTGNLISIKGKSICGECKEAI